MVKIGNQYFVTLSGDDYEKLKNDILGAISSGTASRNLDDETALNAIATAITLTGSSAPTDARAIATAVDNFLAAIYTEIDTQMSGSGSGSGTNKDTVIPNIGLLSATPAPGSTRDSDDEAALNAIAGIITGVPSATANVSNIVNEVQIHIDGLNTAKTTAENDLIAVTGERDTVKGELTTAQSNLATAQSEITRLTGELATAKDKIIDLEKQLNPCMAIDTIIQSITATQTAIGGIKVEIDTIVRQIITINPSANLGTIQTDIDKALQDVDNALTAAQNAEGDCNAAIAANKLAEVNKAEAAKTAAEAAKTAANDAKTATETLLTQVKATAETQFDNDKADAKQQYDADKTQIENDYSVAKINGHTKDGKNLTDTGKAAVTAARDAAIAAIDSIISQIQGTNFDAGNPATTFDAALVNAGITLTPIADIIKKITDAIDRAEYDTSGPDTSGDSIDDLIKQLTKTGDGKYDISSTEDATLKFLTIISKIESDNDLAKVMKDLNNNNNVTKKKKEKKEWKNTFVYFKDRVSFSDYMKNLTDTKLDEIKSKETINEANVSSIIQSIINKLQNNKLKNKYLYKDLKKIYKTMKKYNLDSNYFNGEIRKLNSKYNIKINKKLLSKLL
jgi:hypothetical protein